MRKGAVNALVWQIAYLVLLARRIPEEHNTLPMTGPAKYGLLLVYLRVSLK